MKNGRKKILITGGLGYVGGRIASLLAGIDQFNVIALTRRSPDQFPNLGIPNLSVVNFDIKQLEFYKDLFTDVKAVIHMAASNEIESTAKPLETIDVNIKDTLKLLTFCEAMEVDRFIYFSTMHVYGSPLSGKIDEDKLPKPIHPYAITHKAAEDFVYATHSKGKMIGISVRMSNSYGPPLLPDVNRWTLLVNDLCKQAVLTEKLVLNSDGMQERDFITLSDVARAILHLVNLKKEIVGDGIFNLGGQNNMRIIDMAELISERVHQIFGKKMPVERKKIQDSNVSAFKSLDYRIDKLMETDFHLKKSNEEEIDKMLVFCNHHFGRKQNHNHS